VCGEDTNPCGDGDIAIAAELIVTLARTPEDIYTLVPH
jgi:hypothetical protein